MSYISCYMSGENLVNHLVSHHVVNRESMMKGFQAGKGNDVLTALLITAALVDVYSLHNVKDKTIINKKRESSLVET